MKDEMTTRSSVPDTGPNASPGGARRMNGTVRAWCCVVGPLAAAPRALDAAGTATIRLATIRPGCCTLSIPGSSGESRRATFAIR